MSCEHSNYKTYLGQCASKPLLSWFTRISILSQKRDQINVAWLTFHRSFKTSDLRQVNTDVDRHRISPIFFDIMNI